MTERLFVEMPKRLRRAAVLVHIVDRGDLAWITPLVQRAKVEAFARAEGFEVVELLSDGLLDAGALQEFFNSGFQVVEDGRADVLVLLQLEAGGKLATWEPNAR